MNTRRKYKKGGAKTLPKKRTPARKTTTARKTSQKPKLKSTLSKIDKKKQTTRKTKMSKGVSKLKSKQPTIKLDVSEEAWLNHANNEYNSNEEIRAFQNRIKHGDLTYLNHFDEAMSKNLKIIVDFLGTAAVWNLIFENKINLYLFKPFPRRLVNSKNNYPDAYFSGSHWNSRKANESELFDPYHEYQIFGTNQFCQTYSMMYLLDKLPGQNNSNCKKWSGSEKDFKKYYYYTLCALKFIKEIVTRCSDANLIVFDDSGPDGNREFYDDTLLPLIDQYIKQYKVCINVIELPERQLTN